MNSAARVVNVHLERYDGLTVLWDTAVSASLFRLQMQCSDGICIDKNLWCDRRKDCSDASGKIYRQLLVTAISTNGPSFFQTRRTAPKAPAALAPHSNGNAVTVSAFLASSCAMETMIVVITPTKPTRFAVSTRCTPMSAPLLANSSNFSQLQMRSAVEIPMPVLAHMLEHLAPVQRRR